MDVAVEAVFFPKDADGPDHLLHGVVRIPQYPGGEEQPLNIIPPVEVDGQVCQFLRRKRRPPGIVAPAVDAIGAVIDTAVAHQHLQERDAPPISGEGMAAAGDGRGGVADIALPEPAADAAGGTGGVILGCVRQDLQLGKNVHLHRAAAWRRV